MLRNALINHGVLFPSQPLQSELSHVTVSVSGDWGLINFTEILLSDFFSGGGIGWNLPNIISLLWR